MKKKIAIRQSSSPFPKTGLWTIQSTMRMKCCLHYNQWNGTSSKNTFLSKIAQVQRRYKQGFRKKIIK